MCVSGWGGCLTSHDRVSQYNKSVAITNSRTQIITTIAEPLAAKNSTFQFKKVSHSWLHYLGS